MNYIEQVDAGTCQCGQPLPMPGAKWCGPKCRARKHGENHGHPGRKTMLQMEPIGIDGEGMDQKYTLLACSTGRYVENESGLDTETCFRFLLSLPKTGLKWGFAFSYDVNMMLTSLSPEELKMLSRNSKVYWQQYRIKHIPGKQLQITDRDTHEIVTIWDLYPWVQSSFVRMLKDFKLADEETIARIQSMKDKREDFRDEPKENIRRYCIEECELLSKGVANILELISSTGFHPRGYYSPGSLASAVMDSHKTRSFRKDPPTAAIRNAAEAAYYGGRSEVSVVGPVDGPIFEYDIRSAYPYAATLLPCFAHGRWVHCKSVDEITPYSVVKVRWTTHRQAIWGPYPVRPKTGSLRFPRNGETWAWGVEVLAGLPLCTNFKVLDGYTWIPECDHRPFEFLDDHYRARQKLKSAGNPQEYVYKLILNSTYGKLAERESRDANTPPKHRFMPWAGLITAHCRATGLELVKEANEDLLLCATDGFITRKEMPLKIGSGLGEWETNNYNSCFIAGPGFYFADGESIGATKTRNRGIARADVSFDRVREEWDNSGRVGRVRISTRRFIGYRLAINRLNTASVWRKFVDVPMIKTLNVEPRREWLTTDPFDGRSIAPSFAMHKALEKEDRKRMNQYAFNLWGQDGKADEQLERVGILVSEIDPWASFAAYEQPDFLIDEFIE